MKKRVWLAVLLAATLMLTACAQPKKEGMRVKCPACGYEFDVPAPTP
jgi:hypothetical protein